MPTRVRNGPRPDRVWVAAALLLGVIARDLDLAEPDQVVDRFLATRRRGRPAVITGTPLPPEP